MIVMVVHVTDRLWLCCWHQFRAKMLNKPSGRSFHWSELGDFARCILMPSISRITLACFYKLFTFVYIWAHTIATTVIRTQYIPSIQWNQVLCSLATRKFPSSCSKQPVVRLATFCGLYLRFDSAQYGRLTDGRLYVISRTS